MAYMLFTAMIMAMLSGPMVEVPKRCIIGCTQVTMHGVDVWDCVYDEQVRCSRFQSECKDEGDVVCRPRVVSLGWWSYMYQTPRSYY